MTEPTIVSLGETDVHVWHLGSDSRTRGNVPREDLLALLSPDERVRYQRFVFDRDRERYLLAHAAVRLILARYDGASPSDLRFEAGSFGRPELTAAGTRPRRLRFNLSHTEALIAVAVCLDRDVGVDVEWHARHTSNLLHLATRFFSPSEVRALSAVAEDSRRDEFFQYWTLKESYIKGRGLGLSIPLDKFSFRLPERRSGPNDSWSPAGFSAHPSLGDAAEEWQFIVMRPTGEHTLAAGVRAGGVGMRFNVRETAIDELLPLTR